MMTSACHTEQIQNLHQYEWRINTKFVDLKRNFKLKKIFFLIQRIGKSKVSEKEKSIKIERKWNSPEKIQSINHENFTLIKGESRFSTVQHKNHG